MQAGRGPQLGLSETYLELEALRSGLSFWTANKWRGGEASLSDAEMRLVRCRPRVRRYRRCQPIGGDPSGVQEC